MYFLPRRGSAASIFPPARKETIAIENAEEKQQPAPPDAGMKIKKHYRKLWRMRQFVEPGRTNQSAVYYQAKADEEPDRNGAAREHRVYHTMRLKATNTNPTTTARNAGRL
jgi:hypothetical protein